MSINNLDNGHMSIDKTRKRDEKMCHEEYFTHQVARSWHCATKVILTGLYEVAKVMQEVHSILQSGYR